MGKAKWILLLLSTSAIFGLSYSLVKFSLSSFDTFALLAMRFLLASFLLGTYIVASNRRIGKNEAKYGLAIGLFLFLSYSTQVYGLNFTSATHSSFISGLSAVMVPVLSAILFLKSPANRKWIATLIAVFGLYVMLGVSGAFNVGDALTLLSALATSLEIIYDSKAVKRCDLACLLFAQVATVTVLSLVATVFLRKIPSGYPLPALGAVVFLAVFTTVLSYFAQLMAQKTLEPTDVSLIYLTKPVFAVLFAFFMFGEALSVSEYAGAAIILIGTYIGEKGGKK